MFSNIYSNFFNETPIQESSTNEDFYKDFLLKQVFIDSNILMNSNSIKLLEELIYNKIKVTIPKIQYDEIYNISKSENTDRSFMARNALKCIELLLDNDLLDAEQINDMKNKKAYADPEFIKVIFEGIEKKQQIIFITEDRDLRIQLKFKLKDSEYKEFLTIYSLSDLPFPLYDTKLKLAEAKEKEEKEALKKKVRQEMGYVYCSICKEEVMPLTTKKIEDDTYSAWSNANSEYLIKICTVCGHEFSRKLIKKNLGGPYTSIW